MKEAAKEQAKDSAKFLADNGGLTNVNADRWPNKDEIMLFAHIIDYDLDAFKKRIADLDDSDDIATPHLAEAIGYRTLDRGASVT